jgi:DNA-binding transcriptional LysR family regulator
LRIWRGGIEVIDSYLQGGNKVTLTQIKYFEAVCTFGSITKAAEELYISRPVISHCLHELESEFGVELFERARTGLELTENGRTLRNLFKEFSGAYSAMLERLRYLERYRARRTITIGITPTIGRFFPVLYNQFHLKHPDINVYVTEIPCNDSRASVMEGKIDAFFTPAESEPFSMLGELQVYSSQMVFCVSSSDPSAFLEEITIEETLERPMATLNSSMPFDGYKNLILRTSQQDLVRKVVAAGTACAVLPQDMVEDWEGIVFIPFKPSRPFTVKLVWNKSMPHNSAFDDLMSFIENYRNEQFLQLMNRR